MKLAIHEIRAACEAIRADRLQQASKTLARVSRIFEQLNNAWDVLRTMTPSEYTQFRDHLGQSSGFQSWQYRAIEFLVGNRNLSDAEAAPARRRRHGGTDAHPDAAEPLSGGDRAARPQRLRESAPNPPTSLLRMSRAKPCCRPGRPSIAIRSKYWSLYELAEKLIDFEDYFRRWRFNHVTTVERVIGLKKRDRRDVGGVVFEADAGRRAVPGIVEGADDAIDVLRSGISQLLLRYRTRERQGIHSARDEMGESLRNGDRRGCLAGQGRPSSRPRRRQMDDRSNRRTETRYFPRDAEATRHSQGRVLKCRPGSSPP